MATRVPIPFGSPQDITRGVARVADHLRAGGLIAYPTETVYGLGCAIDPAPLARLAAMKQRSGEKAFLLLIDSRARLDALAVRVTEPAAVLADAFWPGPLTLVLPAAGALLPSQLRGAGGGIAVRWTSHPGALAIIGTLGAPISSTSANLPGLPPATTATEIVMQWDRRVSTGELVVLDAGVPVSGVPSTIVDCTGARPSVVRYGAIGTHALSRVIPEIVGEA